MNRIRIIRRATALAAALFAVVLTAGPAAATTLFALVDTGELFSSADGGVTWSIRATLPVNDAVAIAAAGTSNELLLTTGSGSVFRSTDAGVNWTGVGTIAAPDVVGMALEPNGDILVLSKSGSVWKSTDDGATFVGIATIGIGNDCAAIAVDGPSGDVFALSQSGAVAKSTSGGTNFSAVGVITTPDAAALLVRSGSLFALTATGAVARSDDDGASWTFVGTFSQVRGVALTTDGSNMVAATAEGLVASSNDATAWNFVGSVNQIHVVALGNDIPSVTGVRSRTPAAGVAVTRLYPNPGVRGTPVTVDLALERDDEVSLELYSVDGRLVAKRAAEPLAAGNQRIEWTPPGGASGVYFLRARTASGQVAHARLVRID